MKLKPTAADVKDQFDYDAETGEFLRKRLRANNLRPETGALSRDGYIVVGINGGHQLIHRLIWLWVHGAWPTKQIEHVNGDKTDNRLVNLRLRNPRPKSDLTPLRLREVLRYDEAVGKFFWLVTTRATRAGDEAGCVRAHGYRSITVDGVPFYAHRLAWFWENGAWPSNWIDHKNGVRDDNRIDNLRDVTPSQNSHNTNKLGPNNTTGFRGVSRFLGKYISQIMVDGQREAIGMYGTIEEASEAYRKRYTEIFGCEPSNENEKAYYRKSRAKKS